MGACYLKLTPAAADYMKNVPKLDPASLTVENIRAGKDSELSKTVPTPNVDIEEMTMYDAKGIAIMLHLYRPLNTHSQTLPAVIYVHGGGWMREAKGSYSYLAAKIAVESKCAVIFVHYSLSPEAKFPVAVEECYSVYDWATKKNSSNFLRIDPERVAVGGDSAGGNLVIALSMLVKERKPENKVKYQFLFYPVCDDKFNTASYYEFSSETAITREHMKFFWDSYAPEKSDRDNILACPNKATSEDLKGMPPTLIITSEADALRDEAEEFTRKLLVAGIPVTTARFLGVLHGFMGNSALFSDETLFALDMATAALRRTFYPNTSIAFSS